MTWAAGAPTYASPTPTYVPEPRLTRYAGFWRRYWGLYVDQTLVGLFTSIAILAIGLFARLMLSATASCETFQMNGRVYQSCTASEGLAITFLVIEILVALMIW